MLWLAFWWKYSGFTPAVTRTAMLLVAAFALLGVWRLARRVANDQVAVATVICTALYPVFFTQSSMAHLDMMACALTIWGLGDVCRAASGGDGDLSGAGAAGKRDRHHHSDGAAGLGVAVPAAGGSTMAR